MKNDLTIFEGIELEVLTKEDVEVDFNGECLFNGKQVCEILNYSENSKPLRNIRDYQKIKVKNSDVLINNFRKLNNAGEIFITKDGIMQLIYNSKNISNYRKNNFIKFLQNNNLINNNKYYISDRNEIKFLDKLEESLESFCIKGKRQYPVHNKEKDTNYRIDYYIPSLNIAIEYDENGHTNYTYEQQEGRQKYIENKLDCKFIRVNDKKSDEYNIGFIIKEIFNMDGKKCSECGCNMELIEGDYICENCGNFEQYKPVKLFN